MERDDPTLVPEWYKAANSSAAGITNLNLNGAGHSEENGSGSASRSRNSVNTDKLVAAVQPSSRGRLNSNEPRKRDKEAHPYSNFWMRGREPESRGRSRMSLGDNRSTGDYSDSSKGSSNKARAKRSQSTRLARQGESWLRKSVIGPRNAGVSRGGGNGDASIFSFERDFPSIGAAEKKHGMDKVSSTGINTDSVSLQIGSSAVIGSDGLVLQTPTATTGLNMAETLIQVPSQVLSPPQLSADTRKIEELTLRQFRQLIPVTPSMPKTLVLNSSEKSKSKEATGDLSGPLKVGQQSSSQLESLAVRGPPRYDIPKTSKAGNFQILNRDMSGISQTAIDIPTVSRVLNPLGSVALAARYPLSPKLNSDCKGNTSSSSQIYFVEKRSLSQAQNRNDFFDSLRKKTSTNNSIVGCEPIFTFTASLSGSEKCGEKSPGTCIPANPATNYAAANADSNCSFEKGNGVTGGCDEGLERFLSDNGENTSCLDPVTHFNDVGEATFLRSLGWEENVWEAALTDEEIDVFLKKYGRRRSSVKPFDRGFQLLTTDTP